jgi:hypothetical protein
MPAHTRNFPDSWSEAEIPALSGACAAVGGYFIASNEIRNPANLTSIQPDGRKGDGVEIRRYFFNCLCE